MSRHVKIAEKKVGIHCPCFIIAEAGVNHNGSYELAKELIDVAAAAGVDAVKFQTFKPEKVVRANAAKAEYQLATTDQKEKQLQMLQQLTLLPETQAALQTYCRQKKLLFMSTPFDEESVDLLDTLDVPVFKISSGEITNWPFIEYVAGKGKPVILSTGMSYLSEVDEAVRVAGNSGCEQLLLLHCVSSYPADPADANLKAIQTMQTAFHLPVGYSDHTLGIEVSLAAAALGACVIEKHITLDKNLPGPDHKASLEPQELKRLVSGIKTIESALGGGIKSPAGSEAVNRPIIRRSLIAASDINQGAVFKPANLQALRPADGISPACHKNLEISSV